MVCPRAFPRNHLASPDAVVVPARTTYCIICQTPTAVVSAFIFDHRASAPGRTSNNACLGFIAAQKSPRMMRTAVPRASQLGKSQLSHACIQRRSKTFVKKVDKNDEVYYTLAKRGLAHDPDPSKEHEFFEMPNLLLDLDADGIRSVRAFEDADEEPMTAKWIEVPRREAVKLRLKKLESQIEESRARVSAIASQPTNAWRISPHDILSAALHGAPRDDTDGQAFSSLVDALRRENGIPSHAVTDDESLLHWLQLRQKDMYKSMAKKGKETYATETDIANALKSQDSILGIRRLVFQSIRGGANLGPFQTSSAAETDLPVQICKACERVLNASPTSDDLRRQTLTFLGNLSERLARSKTGLGPVLGGLALKVAAKTGSVAAVSEWFYRVHEDSEMTGSHGAGQDLRNALSALQHDMHLEQGDVDTRLLLFQTLTGADKNGVTGLVSVRESISSLALEGSNAALEAYAAYISLLGRLGATRTLWREWREPLLATMREMGSQDLTEWLYLPALKEASVVMCPGDGEPLGGDGFEDCARADHHAIGTQHAATLRGSVVPEDLGVDKCRAALALPVEEFVSDIASWQSQ